MPYVFGQDAPCRACRGSGRQRGSGLDERQRATLRDRKEELPTTHPCDECAGTGVVPAAVADSVERHKARERKRERRK
jgi:hypothetical protein